jgi:hypothetical protein
VPALPSVFMSYSSKDLEIVEGIENYFLQNGFYDVWRNKRKIQNDWSREIANALSKKVLFFSFGQKIHLSQIALESKN